MRNIDIVAQLHLGIATMSAQCNTKFNKFSLKCHPIYAGIAKDPSVLLVCPIPELNIREYNIGDGS